MKISKKELSNMIMKGEWIFQIWDKRSRTNDGRLPFVGEFIATKATMLDMNIPFHFTVTMQGDARTKAGW